jgi:hypothetical protein
VHSFNDLFAEETSLSAESQAHFEAVTPDTLAKVQFTSSNRTPAAVYDDTTQRRVYLGNPAWRASDVPKKAVLGNPSVACG